MGLGGGHITSTVRQPADLDSSLMPYGGSANEATRPGLLLFDFDHNEKETNLSNNDDATSSLDATDEVMQWHLQL
jgi:hypothetical protein